MEGADSAGRHGERLIGGRGGKEYFRTASFRTAGAGLIRRCIEDQAFAQNRLVRMYQTSWRKSLIINGALGRQTQGEAFR